MKEDCPIEKKSNFAAKYFFYLASAFAVLAYGHYFLKEMLALQLPDFAHYYVYSKMLISGVNIWDLGHKVQIYSQAQAMSAGLGFSDFTTNIAHSPGFFLLISPLTLLPFPIASVLWVILSQSAFILSIVVMSKAFNIDNSTRAIFVFFAYSASMVMENTHLGQVDFFIFFALCLAFYRFRQGKLSTAGLILGFVIQLKEIFAPMLLFLIRKKSWRSLVVAIGFIAGVHIASIAVFGFDVEIAYWHNVMHYLLLRPAGYDIYDRGLQALGYRLCSGSGLFLFVRPLIILAIILFVVKAYKRILPKKISGNFGFSSLEYGLMVTLCLVVSPWVKEPHYLFLLIPFWALWIYLTRECKPKRDFLIFGALYLAMALPYSVISYPIFHKGFLSLFLHLRTFFCIGLFIFIYYLLGRGVGHNESTK